MKPDLSFFAPWMLWASLAVLVVTVGHKRYFFRPNMKRSPLGRFMVVFVLYFLPGIAALFFGVLSALNLALLAGYAVPPLLGQLVFFAGAFGLTALVIRGEFKSIAQAPNNRWRGP